jgi:hypothetical protein
MVPPGSKRRKTTQWGRGCGPQATTLLATGGRVAPVKHLNVKKRWKHYTSDPPRSIRVTPFSEMKIDLTSPEAVRYYPSEFRHTAFGMS